MCLPIFAHAVVLPKSLGALTDGSVESPAMHPTPMVGRPPGQRGRKPGRRKTKVTGPWSQKGSALGPQSMQSGKGLEPIKVPKKRGPKPGSKVGMEVVYRYHQGQMVALSCGVSSPKFQSLPLMVSSHAGSFIFPRFCDICVWDFCLFPHTVEVEVWLFPW